ncbi:hypothetical protein C791_6158 [Amycolatopsis azurea DSM 43854]|uniref:Uncharacterized protein n=1 Tax=Amycolatopsis azurea DSM 43854 TaxID=1238180 RepID=M2P215_9PSEU|nr:hypothetical protein C791_6158 [Amycolatopsis azurea DSM 43854]
MQLLCGSHARGTPRPTPRFPLPLPGTFAFSPLNAIRPPTYV